jgi:hypothetical protein
LKAKVRRLKVAALQRWAGEFMYPESMPGRVKELASTKESRYFKIGEKGIADLTMMSMTRFGEWLARC